MHRANVAITLTPPPSVMAEAYPERVMQLIVILIGFPITTALLAQLIDVVLTISRPPRQVVPHEHKGPYH